MYALLLMLSLTMGGPQVQPTFQYDVVRTRSMQKDEPGQLLIDGSGIQYRSANGKTSLKLPFIDVHAMDVADPSMIRIETYELLKRKLSGRRSYAFRLHSARTADDNDHLTQFLSGQIRRPLLRSETIAATPEFEIPAYHRHVVSGCGGSLQITPEGIRFLSTREDHSRTWKYSEIETVGGSDPVLGEFRKYPEFFSLIPQSMRHLSLSPAGITKLLLCADRGGFLHIFVTRESEPEAVPI
jgi:hypothetical protein